MKNLQKISNSKLKQDLKKVAKFVKHFEKGSFFGLIKCNSQSGQKRFETAKEVIKVITAELDKRNLKW